MGNFSKIIAEKSNLELMKIGDSILDYQALFIFDYLVELDERGLLFDFKILITNNNLINIALKIKDISDSKYLNLLQKEISFRGISIEYENHLSNVLNEELKKKNEKWYSSLFDGILEIFLFICVSIIVFVWILYKEGVIFKPDKINKQEIKYEIPPIKNISPNIDIPPIKAPRN